MSQPCVACGACCASYRVSFYWAETDAHPAGQVPQALTEAISPQRVAMRGTLQHPVRCVALRGEVGQQALCDIYPLRASTCHEVQPGDDKCLQARARHGLPALEAAAHPGVGETRTMAGPC